MNRGIMKMFVIGITKHLTQAGTNISGGGSGALSAEATAGGGAGAMLGGGVGAAAAPGLLPVATPAPGLNAPGGAAIHVDSGNPGPLLAAAGLVDPNSAHIILEDETAFINALCPPIEEGLGDEERTSAESKRSAKVAKVRLTLSQHGKLKGKPKPTAAVAASNEANVEQ